MMDEVGGRRRCIRCKEPRPESNYTRWNSLCKSCREEESRKRNASHARLLALQLQRSGGGGLVRISFHDLFAEDPDTLFSHFRDAGLVPGDDGKWRPATPASSSSRSGG